MTVKPHRQLQPCLGALSPDHDRRRVFPALFPASGGPPLCNNLGQDSYPSRTMLTHHSRKALPQETTPAECGVCPFTRALSSARCHRLALPSPTRCRALFGFYAQVSETKCNYGTDIFGYFGFSAAFRQVPKNNTCGDLRAQSELNAQFYKKKKKKDICENP
jgi:hypothetical protein